MKYPRILLVLTEFPPRIGGMQTHALYLARHLAQRGYPIEVATYHSCGPYEAAATRALDGALPFPVRRCMSRLGWIHNHELLEDIARRFQPDLIYSSTIFYGDLGRRLGLPMVARSVGNDVLRPWIVYPYGPLSALISDPRLEESLYRFFRRLDYPEAIEAIYRRQRREAMIGSARAYDRVLANSRFTAELLEGIGLKPEQIQMLVGGVDSSRFAKVTSSTRAQALSCRAQWGIPEGRYLLMTACRMVRKKGVDFLLENFAQLVDRMPDLHLMLVGSGRHAKRFRQMARRSPVADHMTFAGRVPHEQIDALYRVADAFVLASRVQVDPATGLRDAETMGRVLCEANAAGLPVVAARSGGIPSVIDHRDNGLLFEPDDVDSLAETLDELRSDEAQRVQMIRRGQHLARSRFDWSIIVRQHEQVFAEILGLPEPSLSAAVAV